MVNEQVTRGNYIYTIFMRYVVEFFNKFLYIAKQIVEKKAKILKRLYTLESNKRFCVHCPRHDTIMYVHEYILEFSIFITTHIIHQQHHAHIVHNSSNITLFSIS